MEKFSPHAYQAVALEYIKQRPYAALFLDMGLGKTAVTLTAVNDWIYDECLGYKVLVIAPARVAESTWTAEAEKWEHLKNLRVVKITGTATNRIKVLGAKADVYTISKENVVWLVTYFGKKWPFNVVIIDESSAFKNHEAKRFRALKRVRPCVERVVELTGTPSPNGLLDLWSQIYILDGGARLGKTYTQYRETYFRPDSRDATRIFSWRLRDFAEQKIYDVIGDICMSLKAEDYLRLPQLIENTILVELDSKARKAVDDFEREWLTTIDMTDITAATASVLAGKLLQMANGAIYDETGAWHTLHNAKVDALREQIDAASGNSVLVFYAFKHDLQRLKVAFPQAVEFKGDNEYKAWNRGEIQVLLAHPASVGYGLNLQAGGNIIVWFGLTWSLELYQQSIARLMRQGQTKPVIVHYLIAKNTYDENLLPALRKKELTQDKLLEAVKAEIIKIKGDSYA